MNNRTVIVTGGARRIGAAICRHLHEQGCDVLIHYHTSKTPAEALVRELNGLRENSAFLLPADLVSIDYMDFIRSAAECTGRLDALVNNASAYFPTPMDAINESDWRTLVDINLKAPLFLSVAARDYLAKSRGSIINISDIYAELPLKDYMIYSMTRSAMTAMTRLLAREMAPGIRVNAVAPGAILWPENMDEIQKQQILDDIPLQRTGSPLDIAETVNFLMTGAAYMTGQVITVDGGRRLTR